MSRNSPPTPESAPLLRPESAGRARPGDPSGPNSGGDVPSTPSTSAARRRLGGAGLPHPFHVTAVPLVTFGARSRRPRGPQGTLQRPRRFFNSEEPADGTTAISGQCPGDDAKAPVPCGTPPHPRKLAQASASRPKHRRPARTLGARSPRRSIRFGALRLQPRERQQLDLAIADDGLPGGESGPQRLLPGLPPRPLQGGGDIAEAATCHCWTSPDAPPNELPAELRDELPNEMEVTGRKLWGSLRPSPPGSDGYHRAIGPTGAEVSCSGPKLARAAGI